MGTANPIPNEPQVLGTPTTTLDDLVGGILERLEDSPTDPMFWSIPFEVRPILIEAMNEAVLVTAEPEKRATNPYALTEATTLFQCPPEAVVVVRLTDQNRRPIPRVSVWDLDRNRPGWQRKQGDKIQYWFPFGLNQFGIYPQLRAAQNVMLTYVALPNVSGRPFDGTENVPFQTEYLEGLEHYAVHAASLKVGGEEFQRSMVDYNDFLQKMQELSKFAAVKGSIRFTRRGGIPAKVSEQVAQ